MFDLLFDPGNFIVWILIVSIIIGAVAVISRPFASFVQFAYPNAKYEAIGNPYIKKSNCEKISESETLDQFIDQLNTQKDYQIQASTASEIQTRLDDHFIAMIDQMKQDHGKKMKAFFDAYIDFTHTWMIKEVIRGVHQHTEIDTESLITTSTSEMVTRFLKEITAATDEEINAVLSSYGFDASFIDLIGKEDTISIQLDSGIDQFFIKKMNQVSVPYKCQQAKHEYVSRLIDIISTKHILRAKQMKYHEKLCQLFVIGDGYEIPTWKFKELCEAEAIKDVVDILDGTSYHPFLKKAMDHYESSSSVQPLLTSLDEAMLDVVKQISQQYYVSIGPSIRFMVSKQIEITNLKIISKGIAERIKKDMITSLLITEADL